MKLLVDGREIPVQEEVRVISEGITGPVDGATNDQLHTVYRANSGTINYEVWPLNTPTTTSTRASHGSTTAQTIATAANTAG